MRRMAALFSALIAVAALVYLGFGALLQFGPTAQDIEATVNSYEAGYFGGLVSISGKAETLQSYNFHTGNPGYLAEDLARYNQLTPEGVHAWYLSAIDFRSGKLASELFVGSGKQIDSPMLSSDFMPGGVYVGGVRNGLIVLQDTH